jgi:hypothetical protein
MQADAQGDLNAECMALINELVLTLARISDRTQRSHALATRLNTFTDGQAVGVMKIIRERALNGNSEFLRLYNSLLVGGILVATMGSIRAGRLAEEARSIGEFWLVALLVDLPAQRTEDQPTQPYLDSTLRDAPLGMRTFLARRPDFKMIQRIARDQDPRVIRHLLGNPRLTEKDVVKIGATRPTSPKVLEEIYHHAKWVARYSVKKTIVFNPYAPLSIALRLLPFLRVDHLEELCEMADANPVLVEQARQLIRNKTRAYSLEDVNLLT